MFFSASGSNLDYVFSRHFFDIDILKRYSIIQDNYSKKELRQAIRNILRSKFDSGYLKENFFRYYNGKNIILTILQLPEFCTNLAPETIYLFYVECTPINEVEYTGDFLIRYKLEYLFDP